MMEATLMAIGTTALLGAAGGVWGLFTVWEQKRRPAPKVDVQVEASEELKQIPLKLEAAFERAIAKHQTPAAVDFPEPPWHQAAVADVVLAYDRLSVAAKQLARPQPELEQILAQLVRIREKLDEPLAASDTLPVDELIDLQKKLVRQVAEAVEPLTTLPAQFFEMAQRIKNTSGSNVTVTAAPPLMAGGGRTPPPAPRRLPPAPRAAPPAPNMATPSIPAPYVGGSILVPAGEPTSLLTLIQQQLQPNCPGSSHELVLSADDAVFFGSASAIGGPLSDANYAFQLAPGGEPRIYRSSFPGNSTPLADLQVFAAAEAVVHVEVTT